ncbi:hypothetical protein QA612_19695 [Evansella sp. AB-P1]|uniref:hypothetical protein n=1 Tax=Evansella sp. AB-P1 TaxID=3037653 RepID=UPI00241C66B0|nr:hypothetical protein [Evansella sp. AB-P1]MDG5789684.1 hypothetical protein [Evansella sp. AB-P1]
MFTDLNKTLKEVKERCRKKKKWDDHLHRAKELLLVEKKKEQELYRLLKKEKADVERLESFSINNLFYTIIGRKLERLEKEKGEVAVAKLKYQEAIKTKEDLEKEIKEYKELLLTVSGCEKEYEKLLLQKETIIKDESTIWTEELYNLLEDETEIESMLNEYVEAKAAGIIAANSLKDVILSLEKAKGWSTFDMLGGGMITTAVKHSHLGTAKDDLHVAQSKLRHFQEELLDIKNHFHIDLEIGNMLTFADYFFDGLIVDWMVHGKISDSLNQAYNMEKQVNDMLDRLEIDLNKLVRKHKELQERRVNLLENA